MDMDYNKIITEIPNSKLFEDIAKITIKCFLETLEVNKIKYRIKI